MRRLRPALLVITGVVLALASVVTWRPDLVRLALAGQMLDQTPRQMDTARADNAPVMPAGCTFDTTPVSVTDGDYQMLRCDTATGDLAVGLSELPAAAALSDNFANPTTTQIGAFLMCWDGATWDRCPGTAADGQLVNSELSAAAALADNLANPTAGGAGAFDLLWDGATWDRAPGNSADGAKVETNGDQVVPQQPSAVACDDTGAIAFTANAADVRIEVWNSGANDVCVRWGTAGTPDRTSLSSCSFVLGAHAGSGTSDVYVTPADMRVGGEAFECDASAATNLVVTAYRTE